MEEIVSQSILGVYSRRARSPSTCPLIPTWRGGQGTLFACDLGEWIEDTG